jgi:hypothetical protein
MLGFKLHRLAFRLQRLDFGCDVGLLVATFRYSVATFDGLVATFFIELQRQTF